MTSEIKLPKPPTKRKAGAVGVGFGAIGVAIQEALSAGGNDAELGDVFTAMGDIPWLEYLAQVDWGQLVILAITWATARFGLASEGSKIGALIARFLPRKEKEEVDV